MGKKQLVEDNKILFSIGGQLLEVIMPLHKDWKRYLPSFGPFRYWWSIGAEEPMFTLEIVNSFGYLNLSSARLLVESSEIVASGFRLLETEDQYIIDIQFGKNSAWHRMLSDKSFKLIKASIQWSDPYAGKALCALIMIAFAQSAVLRQTLLLHASVVENNGRGYAFLGKSGTGKSTHSGLWIKHIEGTRLLNDDNPAISVGVDGKVYIYGTPWSGKTPCYRNSKVPLTAFVRLEQASFNKFMQCSDGKALITLLPSCSSMRWNICLYTALCDTLEMIIGKVPVCLLDCLPDTEAAMLCYNEIENRYPNKK